MGKEVSREEMLSVADILSDPDRPIHRIATARRPGDTNVPADDLEDLLERSNKTAADRAKRSIRVMKLFGKK